MKSYTDYKDSHIDWLGNIPAHWKKTRLRYVCDVTTGSKDTINRDEGGLYPFFVRSKVIERINSVGYDGEAILTAGDGDICKIWHYYNGKFDFHQRVYMLHNFKNISGRFLYYYISENFLHDVFKLSAKNTVDSLRLPMFLNFPVLVPPRAEQDAIVEYLDNRISQIKVLIEKNEALISLLKFKRQSRINETVTRGLNPNAPQKKVSISWLTQLPEHWKLTKLRYLGKAQNGVSQGGEYFGGGDPFVSYSDVYKNDVLPQKVNGMAHSTDADKMQFSVEEGDVFFTRTSETVEEIGLSSVCLQTIKNAVFAGFLIRFRPFTGVLDKNFSRYFFRSFVTRAHFIGEMNLVTRASLSQELLKSLPVCVPPLQEQIQIAEHLKNQLAEIDEAIKKVDLLIINLQAYSRAIIAEAVSGKFNTGAIENAILA